MSDLPARAGEHKFAAHNVIAVYPDVTQARAALTTLERKGIEAGNIELLGPGMEEAGQPQTNEQVRDSDERVIHQVEKRGGIGFLIGALIGMVVLAAAAAVAHYGFDAFDSFGGLLIGALIGGAILGGGLGFFYGGATGLPVSDAWGETYMAVRGGKTAVAVHSEEAGQVEKAVEALRASGAEKVERFGPDGKTRPA